MHGDSIFIVLILFMEYHLVWLLALVGWVHL